MSSEVNTAQQQEVSSQECMWPQYTRCSWSLCVMQVTAYLNVYSIIYSSNHSISFIHFSIFLSVSVKLAPVLYKVVCKTRESISSSASYNSSNRAYCISIATMWVAHHFAPFEPCVQRGYPCERAFNFFQTSQLISAVKEHS